MAKVLIYKSVSDLKPVGGPNGYLYNLQCGLQELKVEDIHFLKAYEDIKKPHKVKNGLKKIITHMPKFVTNFYRKYQENKNYNLQFEFTNRLPADYQSYDFIHFHSTLDLYQEQEQLKNYRGKVLLTSHSPKPRFQEFIDYNFLNPSISKQMYHKLEQIDIFAFQRADYIIFPCKEAEEPYYNQWEYYQTLHEENAHKYRYMLTGTKPCVAKVSRNEVRKKYHIPEDAFLACYVGRHNEVKGYDVLCNLGKDILDEIPNFYFIIAGKEGPLYHLEHSKWVEVGWTNDPHSIISSSDLFILPNKETYFDLIFLEVLSLNVPILASNTGGNKYYQKFSSSDILLYETIEDMKKKLLEFYQGEKKVCHNRELFEAYFKEDIFAKNYLSLISSLEEDSYHE